MLDPLACVAPHPLHPQETDFNLEWIIILNGWLKRRLASGYDTDCDHLDVFYNNEEIDFLKILTGFRCRHSCPVCTGAIPIINSTKNKDIIYFSSFNIEFWIDTVPYRFCFARKRRSVARYTILIFFLIGQDSNKTTISVILFMLFEKTFRKCYVAEQRIWT